MLPEIQKFIELAYKDKAYFVPTEIFNEGFLLKIVFQFAIDHPGVIYRDGDVGLILNNPPGTKYFCEGLLYTHFRQYKDDNLWESNTHADGVIGNFIIREGTKARIILAPGAKHFTIIEAKVGSKLSEKVTHASFYDQAARNVACIAETLFDAGLNPLELETLGFYILAPQQRIDEDLFSEVISKDSINEKVQMRIAQYEGNQQRLMNAWYNDWFLPTLKHIEIRQISWEVIIDNILERFPDRTDLKEYYQHCLKHNGV